MNLAPRFGAFGGVFTPSILTILGVIMYLRLPWIIGQAGLYTTIGIIIVSHIISVTTGLSVASISTDKRVSVGGNYYIISRSLGLSIGGTMGLALFVGLSFSISLYIIGFVESFLPVWNIEPTPAAIRLYGTIAVLVVTAIILFSTSLAIRIQCVIMAAIGLSLLSIVIGGTSTPPAAPLLNRPDGGAPFMLLFGIFFPAVTGFTAGVQMSGDLKDPRMDIPRGTIAAILVGFLVYVGLAILFAYRIGPEDLVRRNVLSDVSLFKPLLYAGIWGATLSSAMGSLLGAPRILQATSIDRITPQVFSRGAGPGNEPRNALWLSFLIAEAGILIAELDVIAAIISIFFITTYGFINLSCAIETWASADFRPSFRIPTWVSVAGSTACVLVMVQLDLLAFVGASILLAVVYTFLKRRELTLESGDTWEGVWSSVTRAGLQQLTLRRPSERNWRPNIILFSGGTMARPYLIEFGRWLVDKRGLLSNFDLIEKQDAELLLNKPRMIEPEGEEIYEGVFHREFECREFYEGMETISQVYGFSGVEPNTVMMGWARKSRDPGRFSSVIRHLADLDYNVLLLDYDRTVGFGKRQRIDIWWEDGSREGPLVLTILKYLKASDAWKDAKVRVLVIVEDSAVEARVSKNMTELLEAQRLNIDVRVVNNAIERKPLHENVLMESRDSDLTILSIPDIKIKPITQFVVEMDAVIAGLGSTLLLSASSFFDPLSIGIDRLTPGTDATPVADSDLDLPGLPPPDHLASGSQIAAYNSLMGAYGDVEQSIKEHSASGIDALNEINTAWLEEIKRLLNKTFQSAQKRVGDLPPPRAARFIAGLQSDTLHQLKRLLDHFQTVSLSAQKDLLKLSLDDLLKKVDATVATCPREFPVAFGPEDLWPGASGSFSMRLLQIRHRFSSRSHHTPATIDIRIRDLLESLVTRYLHRSLLSQLETVGVASYELMSDIRKLGNTIYSSMGTMEISARDGSLDDDTIDALHSQLTGQVDTIANTLRTRLAGYCGSVLSESRLIINTAATEIGRLDVNRRINRYYRSTRTDTQFRVRIEGAPDLWSRNQNLMITFVSMDVSAIVFRHRLQTIVTRLQDELRLACDSRVIAPLQRIEETITGFDPLTPRGEAAGLITPIASPEPISTQDLLDRLRADIQPAFSALPESLEILEEQAFKHLDTSQFEFLSTVEIPLRRQMEYLVESELLSPLQIGLAPVAECFRTCLEITEDVVRLIQYNLETGLTDDETTEADPVEPVAEILRDSVERVATERTRMKESLALGLQLITDRMRDTSEAMNPYWLTRTATHLRQDIRSQEGKRLIARSRDQVSFLKRHMQRAVVKLMYRKSEGVLFARRMKVSTAGRKARIENVIELVEFVTPPPRVLSALPFYYRQLFLSKQPIRQEFWIRRPDERRQADQAYRRYKEGFAGAILVLGEANSGKTTFCRRVAEAWCASQKVVHLFPPEGGSTDPEQFKVRLEDAVRAHGDYDEIFRAIPAGGVVVVNDLELWWERSPGGTAVLDLLMTLIGSYGDRVLFLVNANTHSYRFMNNLMPVEHAFLGVVECGPFDVEDIQQAILRRHRSAGMTFRISGNDESDISDFGTARLFAGHFDVSSGNIGVAFQAWISSIDGFSGETIDIHTPNRPSIEALQALDWDWMVWLQQFVLHKHLTETRLGRIFRCGQDKVNDRIQAMKRAGLAVESQPAILEINPFVRPFITQTLKQMNML